MSDLRAKITEALALHRNGPASDGRGWYRDAEEERELRDQADAVMGVVDARVRELEDENQKLRDRARDIAKKSCDHCSGSRVDPDRTHPPENGDPEILVPCPMCARKDT